MVVRHPLFSMLSLYATLKSYSIAKKIYPKTSSTSGKGNAFRHALWTCLVCMYCSKVSSSQKAMDFAKKFTDQHEDLFPNEPLETKMDLHNNLVGLELYSEMLSEVHRQFFETNFFVEKLTKLTEKAVKIDSQTELRKGTLVYLD